MFDIPFGQGFDPFRYLRHRLFKDKEFLHEGPHVIGRRLRLGIDLGDNGLSRSDIVCKRRCDLG